MAGGIVMSLLDEVKDKIKELDSSIARSLDGISQVRTLGDAMTYYPSAGGKRLRPLLAMLIADAISGTGRKTIPFGVALELTHNFTLVHDDLMDRDEIRRGIPSLHKKFGTSTAINAGDALFARAFEMLATLDDPAISQAILRDFSWMVRAIAEGQQLDMEFESRDDVTEKEYLTMVEKKTALMFWMAAKGGALISGAPPEHVESAAEYGRIMGIGFQIWDDLLDVTGDQDKIGKKVGSDIMNGKKTMIVIEAMGRLEGGNKEKFLAAFNNPNATQEQMNEVIQALHDVGAIEYTRKMASEYAENAKHNLDFLPDSEEKELLMEFVDFMVKREH